MGVVSLLDVFTTLFEDFCPKYHPTAAITKLFRTSFFNEIKTVIPNITIKNNTIIALTDTPAIVDSFIYIHISMKYKYTIKIHTVLDYEELETILNKYGFDGIRISKIGQQPLG